MLKSVRLQLLVTLVAVLTAAGIIFATGRHLQEGIRGGDDPLCRALAWSGNPNATDSQGCRTLVYEAIQSGQNDIVELLIWRGADIRSSLYPGGPTALHLASIGYHVPEYRDGREVALRFDPRPAARRALAELLLAHGADVNARDTHGWSYMFARNCMGWRGFRPAACPMCQRELDEKSYGGMTPLHWAAIEEAQGVAEVLVAHGADVNAVDNWNMTPLHMAAARNTSAGLVALLLDHGANGTALDQWGETPLHFAASRDQPEVVALLLAHGADPDAKDQSGETPLERAGCENGNRLLMCVNKESLQKKDALYAAVWSDSEAAVLILLARGADVNMRYRKGATPLHNAAALGYQKIVEILLAHGADPNSRDEQGNTPLLLAAKYKDIVKLLMAKGARVNDKSSDGGTLLHGAADQESAQLLISKGIDVNAETNAGRTPLHNAAEGGFKDVVALLLAKRVNVDPRDNDGRTPLSLAAERTHLDVVEILVAKGADVNAPDNTGRTPLHCAAHSREIAEFLIANGADIKAKDKWGETPLHRAVYCGHTDTAEFLLAHGADLKARGQGGLTPLQSAVKQGYKNTPEMLRRHGAEE